MCTRFASISPFASLVGIPVGIASSVLELKICDITGIMKRYKSLIIKKKKKHDKIVLLAFLWICFKKYCAERILWYERRN